MRRKKVSFHLVEAAEEVTILCGWRFYFATRRQNCLVDAVSDYLRPAQGTGDGQPEETRLTAFRAGFGELCDVVDEEAAAVEKDVKKINEG